MTQEIIIVSGFKRSGTSLMMHILKHLDVPLYYDHEYESFLQQNLPDTANKYYYEHPEIVEVFQFESEQLRFLQGFAVKSFVFALMNWPETSNIPVKLVLMTRDLDAIAKSMQKYKTHPSWQQFLIDKANAGYQVSNENIIDELERLSIFSYQQLQDKFSKNPLNTIHNVAFEELISHPHATIKTVAQALSLDVDEQRIDQAVQNSLRR